MELLHIDNTPKKTTKKTEIKVKFIQFCQKSLSHHLLTDPEVSDFAVSVVPAVWLFVAPQLHTVLFVASKTVGLPLVPVAENQNLTTL